MNGLKWGFDGWLYGAHGEAVGGKIELRRAGGTVNANGRDFRIQPDRGLLDPQAGASQYGRNRDDWGNWFGNTNSEPMFQYVLDDDYLRRNEHVAAIDGRDQVSENPGAAEVFPRSRTLARFNDLYAANRFTSCNSTIVYRDDFFGPAFEGNAFMSEPVHNLVHREIMRPDGVTFTSRRADDETQSEFLASADNWFRPTMLAAGPDGALWVADMYRQTIEHPEWIPLEIQEKLDLPRAPTGGASTASTRWASDRANRRGSTSFRPPSWSPRSTRPAAGSATWPNNCSCGAATRRPPGRSKPWRQDHDAPPAACRRCGRWNCWAASRAS